MRHVELIDSPPACVPDPTAQRNEIVPVNTSQSSLAFQECLERHRITDRPGEAIRDTIAKWKEVKRDSHFRTAVYALGNRYRLIPHHCPGDIYEFPADDELP